MSENVKTKKESKTYWVYIYSSGDIEVIKQICRKYVMKGLCVTVEPVTYIYTGGEELGVRIGLLNYPRFPVVNGLLWDTAYELANLIRIEAYQLSVLIIDNEKTLWLSDKYEE